MAKTVFSPETLALKTRLEIEFEAVCNRKVEVLFSEVQDGLGVISYRVLDLKKSIHLGFFADDKDAYDTLDAVIRTLQFAYKVRKD